MCRDAGSFITNTLWEGSNWIKAEVLWEYLIHNFFLINCSLQSSCKHFSLGKDYIVIWIRVNKDTLFVDLIPMFYEAL